MRIWKEFKEKIGVDNFNVGIIEDECDIPNELFNILKDANGQKLNHNPIFIEFKNDILGLDVYLYKFLSYNDILNLKKEMQEYAKEDSLFPFAVLVNRKIGDKGAIAFAISNFDKKIYKVQFYSWDRFGQHIEFKKELFANNFAEFIENQILWRSLI